MKLSMGMLYDALSEEFALSSFDGRQGQSMELKNAGILTGAPPEPGIVYLVEARRLPVRWRHSGKTSLIVVGGIPEAYFDGTDVVCFCVEDNRFGVVFNSVLRIFSRYQEMDIAMRTAVMEGETPEHLCGILSSFLHSPMIVFDEALRLTYCSADAEGLMEWETDTYSGMRLLPTEFINQLNLVYMDAAENFVNDAVLLRDDRLPYNLITTLNGKNDYIITIFETGRVLNRSMLQVVSYCNEYILRLYAAARGKNPASNCLEALIRSLLDGTKYSANDLEIQLESVGWKSTDNCCCIVVHEPYNRCNSKSLATFCLKVEKQFKACVAFMYCDRAVVVVNLMKSGCTPRDIPNRIGILIREGLLKAGVSFKYWIFEATPIYYKQACSAFELGEIYNPSNWCYLFEDVALRYFMHYGSSVIPPRHLCHPALVELHRYDVANGTDLLRTLETYVGNNCNAVTASNLLFIHRNTFYQRLARIQELLNLNLDNADVRLYLQLSTYLISMYYFEKDNGLTFPAE
ncbi:MAG: helix-turn-helix domain-containing protein [Oscillospiraceae bacterium]|nr:helix-turn-helix domain-containing protein [Oscillospiraceae bacterium]